MYKRQSLYSLGHGGNDAQKTMGLIWMLLIASGYAADDGHLPLWVIVSCYAAIGFGTLFGGWRIVKTMAVSYTHLPDRFWQENPCFGYGLFRQADSIHVFCRSTGSDGQRWFRHAGRTGCRVIFCLAEYPS